MRFGVSQECTPFGFTLSQAGDQFLELVLGNGIVGGCVIFGQPTALIGFWSIYPASWQNLKNEESRSSFCAAVIGANSRWRETPTLRHAYFGERAITLLRARGEERVLNERSDKPDRRIPEVSCLGVNQILGDRLGDVRDCSGVTAESSFHFPLTDDVRGIFPRREVERFADRLAARSALHPDRV
jgi:hypothetical protein